MHRVLAPLLFTWAVLLGPALCVAGVLEHSCECGHEADAQCEHEEACASDPCASVTRPQDQETRPLLDLDEQLAGALLPSLVAPTHLVPAPRPEPASPTGPPRGVLPYPPSDRPLRT